MSNETCSACATPVASYDGVFLSAEGGRRFLCSRCYNETIAEYLGLHYEHVAFEPVTLEDRDGIPHTFQFRTHIFSDQLSLEALETGPQEGYAFSVIADAEQDLFVTFQAAVRAHSARAGSQAHRARGRRATGSPTPRWCAGRSPATRIASTGCRC